MTGLGEHYLAEFYECDSTVINDEAFIEKTMVQAIERSGATLINTFIHKFTPHGISGVIIIAESHCAIHCWPEHKYAAVDLFSCSEFDYNTALDYICEKIGAKNFTVSVVDRGILPDRNGTIKDLEIKPVVGFNSEKSFQKKNAG